MSWAGKKVLVLGAGESGLSMARHLADAGASLRVADTREAPPGAAALRAALPEADVQWGPFTASLFEGVDAVVASPGVPVSGPLADAAVLEAQKSGVAIIGDVELFARALAEEKEASGYAPKVLAITGTNGKTTVTALTAFLARHAGRGAVAAGNISPAVLDAWRDAKGAGALPDVWVLELSSYQLETTASLHPDAAVMLNLSEDHLDRHGDMQAYAAAKARIFAGGGLQILNRDDPASMAMRRPFTAKNKRDVAPIVVTFGSSEPHPEHGEHEYGLVREARPGGLVWLAEGANRLMPLDVLKIKGLHNAMNALAALALNRAIGLPLAPMLKALKDYAGEAHRVQAIAEVAGVTYIDDSKGTNVGATLAALGGLGGELRDGRKIVLIAGGDGKGQNFAPLARPVASYCRAVMLIGRDAGLLRAALADTGVTLADCATLEQAVAASARVAQSGDLALLSPACASFDMFRNYGHRASVFMAAVRDLGREPSQEESVAQEVGEPQPGVAGVAEVPSPEAAGTQAQAVGEPPAAMDPSAAAESAHEDVAPQLDPARSSDIGGTDAAANDADAAPPPEGGTHG